MFGNHRGGGAKLLSKMIFGAEGVSRAMVTLLTLAPKALVYATLERLSLCNSSFGCLSGCPLPSRLSSSRCPLCGMSSAGVLIVLLRTESYFQYKDRRILPMPSISLTQLPPDRQADRQRKHTETLTTPTYNTCLLRHITTIHNGFQQLYPILSSG